nr:MAG: hypothetical protein KatS3mg041_1306 [Bacteroidota bacterium]
MLARVGEARLTLADLRRDWPEGLTGPDSVRYVAAYVEQWIQQELLYQAAREAGMLDSLSVRRRIQAAERAIAVGAFLSRWAAQQPVALSEEEMRAYFEAHRDEFRLSEDYVQIRYLATFTRQAAEEARRALLAGRPWPEVVHQYAADTAVAGMLSRGFHPISRLLQPSESLNRLLGVLRPGEVSPVVEWNGLYHVVQLVERRPVGSLPEWEWVRQEVRQRLEIMRRKQRLEELVQQLRRRIPVEVADTVQF